MAFDKESQIVNLMILERRLRDAAEHYRKNPRAGDDNPDATLATYLQTAEKIRQQKEKMQRELGDN